MKDQIHVSTANLEDEIVRLKALYDDWGGTEAPSSNVDARESEDDLNLQSESKTMENLKHQVVAARRAKRYFVGLIQTTANYLANTKDAFNTADNS